MSLPILDYLPCDLTRYSQHVLPAWQAARQGDLHPLRELIDSVHHFSYWPVFNIPNPLPNLFFAGPKNCFGWDYFKENQPFWPQFFDSCRFVPTLLEPLPENFVVGVDDQGDIDFWQHRYLPELRETLPQEFFTTTDLDFWALCSHHLPTLFDANASTKPQTFLLGCLFYTFCCQLPSEPMRDCRVIINEGVYFWEEYMARSEHIKTLWDRFKEPAPQPLADQLLVPRTYQDYLASLKEVQRGFGGSQRALVNIGHDITGFLDHEEVVHFLSHLPTNERPELDAIISGCIRDHESKHWPLSPELEQLLGKTRDITDEQQIKEKLPALYTKQETAPIWQMWLFLCELYAERLQIPIEGAVVKWLEFDLDSILSAIDPPRQLQERLQAMPCGVRVGSRKEVIAHPHAQIRESQLENRHDLVFAVIQFIHFPFLLSQIFKSSEQFTLFPAVLLTLRKFFVTRVIRFPLPLLVFFDLGIGSGFLFFDHLTPLPVLDPLSL